MKYKLKAKNKNLKKYNDILFINEWPNKILVDRYDEAKKAATETEMRLKKLGLYEQEAKPGLVKKYKRTLKQIEFLEHIGRERGIFIFYVLGRSKRDL